jgi:hypothetical protein
MTNNTTSRILIGLCTVSTLFALLGVTAAAQTTTTEKIRGTATSTTSQKRGTVVYVEGNTVVVAMSTGQMRTVTVPDSRTAVIDGKEITVHDLKVGTKLTATMVTTTTPVTERTITVGSGTVWYVSGNNVILTMADGKNKMFKVKPGFKFTSNGRPATVFDLRKGMKVSGEKIVEEPVTEIASNTTITGTAPKPKPVVAAAPAPAPVKEAAPEVVMAAAAPEPAPEPAHAPAKLPKTGSPLPLAGILGLLCTGAGFGLRMLRRS